jgi:hypothetical protein
VNTYTTSAQQFPAVAMAPEGAFVVAWTSFGPDGDGQGIRARRYDAAGVPQGAEFPVNTHTAGTQIGPDVATDAAGHFVVVWASLDQDGSGYGVFGQRFDAAGAPLGAEFQVNGYTTGHQFGPGVMMDARGGFVVSWIGLGQDGSGQGGFARAFTADGAPQGDEFQVNAYTTGHQSAAAMAPQGGGRYVATWASSGGQDGDLDGQFARRFAMDTIFDDGFESGDLSAWSAASTDGGDLGVSGFAALGSSTAGLRGLVDDTAGIYVEDRSPDDEDRYRARFLFDTNGFDPGEAAGTRRTRIFILFEEAPLRRLAAVVLRRVGGVYGIMGRARRDDNSQADTGFFTIADGTHSVELDWRRSSAPEATDGHLHLWIDGTLVSTLDDLDNDGSAVDFVRLGALSVKASAGGTLYWDEFVSRRLTGIGP